MFIRLSEYRDAVAAESYWIKRLSKYGLCLPTLVPPIKEMENFLNRIQSNVDLENTIKRASEVFEKVLPREDFDGGSGLVGGNWRWISIDISASDKEIIKFLASRLV